MVKLIIIINYNINFLKTNKNFINIIIYLKQ